MVSEGRITLIADGKISLCGYRSGSRIERCVAGTQCALKTQMQLHVLDRTCRVP